MSSTSRETTAIVLDSHNHGESDKIVTFFSSDLGRMTGIAKGANRSKKRFLNKLELFSNITLYYSENRRSTLYFISDAELDCSFMQLRSNITCYNAATFVREILLIAATEGEKDPRLFNLLHWTLHSLDCGKPPLAILTIFLVRLLGHIGYRPDLNNCHGCGSPLCLEEHNGFSHRGGGLICSRCLATAQGGCTNLSAGTVLLLRSALAEPLGRLHRLQFSRRAAGQALPALQRYSRNLFQREIHSWKTLQKML
ncbi:MAG: DNA repair protein RecO [Desulfopila sp.]